MDIEGAKALKKRLGADGVDEASPSIDAVDIPADAPPVYRWTGKTPSDSRAADAEEQTVADSATLFRRLGLSFR